MSVRDSALWEQASEGLTDEEKDELEEVVEHLVSAVMSLQELRGAAYTALFLEIIGQKLAAL